MYHRRSTNRSRSSFSASRTAARTAYHRGDDDLTRAMGRMSVRATSNIRIPPLSAFSSGAVAVAGSAVRVGECIPRAESIPTNFRTPTAYLKAMQAHTQKEFEASARQGVSNADRQGGGWLLLTCRPNPRWQDSCLSYYVHGKSENGGLDTQDTEEDGHNFKQDPWSRHLVEFEDSSIALVVACVEGVTDNQAFLAIVPGADGIPVLSEHLQTRVRSLGYVGSFLREYGSAAELLRRDESDSLLNAVAAPGQCTLPSSSGAGTFLPRGQVFGNEARLGLHSKNFTMAGRMANDAELLFWRDAQATWTKHLKKAKAVSWRRLHLPSFPGLRARGVFGNEARLGLHSKNFTMAGRMANDAELLFWRDARATWTKHLEKAKAVSWRRLHLPSFPGIARLLALEQESLRSTGTGEKHDKLRRSGRTAGKWAFALTCVLKANFYKRLENGSRAQRLMLRQLNALDKWVRLLSQGASRVASLLMRLEGLTRFRIFTETRVLICTVDSTERMVRTMEEGTREAAIAIGHELDASSCRLTLDTAIMDEAACVLEAAVPVLLALGIKNLTLVGDHRQLQPFSQVRENEAGKHHSRSLMERAIDSGRANQFLDLQYRMHPTLCQVVSSTFYDGKLKTAEELRLTRMSHQPCKWVHVSGGETKHQGRGYSNHLEIPKVVEEVRASIQRYGTEADIRVNTFYNMQKRDLERDFKHQPDMKHVRIVSVPLLFARAS
ncbi:unnamed protein product [Ectocarpus sp. CCAP 1310/34]|nr:unnamed protein product [Ectocarpus sp. CCAP 1310/34]